MEQRLSLITLGVRDVAASRAFYERLGWRPSGPGNDGVAFFQMGGVVLSLYGRADLARDIGAPEPTAGSPGMTIAQNVRDKTAVDCVLAQAVAAGAKLLKPGHDVFWGGYIGFFADPDGHVWEIAWNPGFELLPNGDLKLPQ